ncbi:MAG TPA: DUF1707 domain-containing protein [Mycobacteriales bacterium]|nr:DUF1707 domain-containing protein [Mycobacteriales bacterium]
MTVEPSPDDRPVPLSDEDRRAALVALHQAELEGRLRPDELETRIRQLAEARARTDLPAVLDGLPDTVLARIPDDVVELSVTSGSITRRGQWTVPRLLRITSRSGSVRLDLSEARIAHDVVAIELTIGSASVHVTLPRGASADINRISGGSVRSKIPDAGGSPHFRISGRSGTGTIRVRYPRRFF